MGRCCGTVGQGAFRIGARLDSAANRNTLIVRVEELTTFAPSFIAEADMLGAIAASPSPLVGRRRGRREPQVFFEFWAAQGTPDLVFLEFDPAEIARRTELGLAPVTGYSEVAVLAALRRGPLNVWELAARVSITPAHLRRSILASLREQGWVVETADRSWATPEPIAPVARWILAVEAKRRDWSRALVQADRYRRFANRSVVVVDATVASASALVRARADGEVGLALLAKHSGRVEPLYLPPWKPPRSRLEFILAGEQAFSMMTAGIRSGPIVPVFGRILMATVGPDPRMPLGEGASGLP